MVNPKPVTEREFTSWLIELAQLRGWMVHHAMPAMNLRGRWATWQQGQAGFPDVVLVHPDGHCVVAELKVGRNRPSIRQEQWLAAFRAAGIEAYLWRWPQDRTDIELRLAII